MKTLLIFLFAFFGLQTFAAETYIFQGNEKTKETHLRNLAQICKKNKEDLRQCLINSKLFSEVEIEQRDEKTLITVKERWSVIPFPYFQAKSDGKKSVGIFLMDGNFLGRGTLLGGGASYSSSKKSFMLFYRDRFFLSNKFTLGGSLSKSDTEIYWKNKKLTLLDAFTENANLARLSLGHFFTSNFTLGPALTYKQTSYKNLENYLPPEKEKTLLVGLEAAWTKEHFKFYFNEGLRFNLNFDQELTGDKNKANFVQASFNLGKEIIHDQVFQLNLTIAQTNKGDKRTALRPKKGKGLRGTPEGGYISNFIASSAFDYQIPLMMTKAGTWTLAPFIDLGFINNYQIQSEELFSRSYGIGSYFFLKGVMLPGLGLVVGRNETFKSTFFEFSIGESF